MEMNQPSPGGAEAAAALAAITSSQKAVRDTPWPVWIYPVNAVLLGAMALTPLTETSGSPALIATAIAVIVANLAAGWHNGAPFALPTSRGFLTAVVLSALCVVLALVTADVTGNALPVIALAVAATTTYAVGSVVHYRSTHR
ncbi:hypothetical protein [Cellulomonas fengjieae]|uniref:hypothetical protein n=1 Tax=Cellulomonas fengjieae TaxID=2819978 RepID=UPI001AAF653F|nr:hypothetical protein [Cellulomonas fengjieae]MBO3103505.1 hypothetical protein [Cellulomonas fengjieae]